MDAEHTQPLIFFVNGEKVIEPSPDPEWTLLQFLREKLRLCGTRLACGEGGCGACTVMLTKFNPETKKISNRAINACLTPLCTLHGTAIVTVEGLGSVRGGMLHPVQERIAKSHGTQCGYCTPGFVMSMYSLLRNNAEPTEDEMETAFQGNLCRCTGYRPILDGFKSFCKVENCCQQRKEATECENGIKRASRDVLFDESAFKAYDPSQDPIFPPELMVNHSEFQKPLEFRSGKVSWFRPNTLGDVLDLKAKFPEAAFVGGGNDILYTRRINGQSFSTYIHVPQLAELSGIELSKNYITIGSGVTYAELASFCSQHRTDNLLLNTLGLYLKKFGDSQLRNTATIGGSIASINNVSDSATFFAAAGASVVIASQGCKTEEVMMDKNFFKTGGGTTITAKQFILALKIPLLNPGEFLWASKVSKRKDVDAAILNVAIKIQLSPNSEVVASSTFAFNGLVFNGVTLTTNFSNYINGRVWSAETTDCMLRVPAHTFGPPADSNISVAYRSSLVAGMLKKFSEVVFKWQAGQPRDQQVLLPRETTQVYEIVPDDQPNHDLVGRPIAHLSGLKQATGEAEFLGDRPLFVNELCGAIVMSTRANAKIIAINYDAALAMKGVVRIFDAKSIEPGRNNFVLLFAKDEFVFAEDEVNFYGQPIAFVVAETQEIAQEAAKVVQVEYENKLPLILNIDDAIKEKSFYNEKMNISSGNVKEGFECSQHVLEGEFLVGGQKHFALEPNGSIGIPKEDNEIEIIATTQAPKNVQSIVCQCLGLRSSEVIVKTKRIGGGFGGRETRPCFLSVCTALAALKLRKPVRCILSRDQDMQLMGGRHPALCRYKVGFSNDGHINAIKANIFLDGGHTSDYSPLVLGNLIRGFTSLYKIPNWEVEGYVCRTNTHSNTAFRGFGNPQASLMIESIVDEVAVAVKKSPIEIRQKHLYNDGDLMPHGYTVERSTMKRCWEECVALSDLDRRNAAIEEFNRANQTKKRGISMTTLAFPIGFPVPFLNQGAALVMIYDDGTVSLNHGGCEMGQGLHTKMMQVASRALGISVSKIHTAETSTDKVPNATTTAASTTADLVGPAIIDACETLLKRLEPIKASNPKGTWEEWIKNAYFNRVNLSATGFNKLEFPGNFIYLSYAAGVTEVEIDCLTGEHQILRTDIVMDVGESLNPAIDVGQIEGAFIQGCGLVTLEEVLYTSEGKPIALGPGTYKCPSVSNVPRAFHVNLLRGAPNPKAVYSSKAIGEPPLLLASSVFTAIKEAIRAARATRNLSPQFRLDSPATVQRIKLAIENICEN